MTTEPTAAASAEPAAQAPPAHSVRVCFARRWLPPELAAQLRPGSILEMDSAASAPAEIFVDGRLAGLGTPLVIEGRLCVRLEKRL